MDNNVMFCAEQVHVPPELGAVLKQFTKAVLVAQPADLAKWSANYFAELADLPTFFSDDGSYVGPPLDGVPASMGDGAAAADSSAPEPTA